MLTAALAPWVLGVLYSDDFRPAATLLQWLAIGSLARLISAPLEAVLTAAGRPRTVLAIGAATLAILLAGSLAAAPRFGLGGIGMTYAASHLVHLGLVAMAARRRTGLAPRYGAMLWLAGLVAAGLTLPGPVALAAALAASVVLGSGGRRPSVSSASPAPAGGVPRLP